MIDFNQAGTGRYYITNPLGSTLARSAATLASASAHFGFCCCQQKVEADDDIYI